MAEASFTIRAVDATRAAFLNVQNSLAQLKQSSATAAAFMKKVFDPRALGAGLASALGISLVGAIDMAVAAIGRMVSRFEDVRRIVNETKVEVAKIYEDAADALLRPDQMLVKLGERRKALEAEIAVLRKKVTPVREEVPIMMPGAVGSMKAVTETVEATAREAALLNEKELTLAKIIVQQDDLRRTVDKSNAAALLEKENKRLKEQEERISLAKGKVELLTSSFDDYIAKVKEGNDEREAQRNKDEAALRVMQSQASAQKDILDPTRELQREIALVNELEKKGLLTLEEAIMRRAQLTAQIQNMTTQQVDGMMDTNTELTQMQRLAQDVGDTIANSFEDAIFTGQKLSTVLRQLALDLMRMLFNQMITQQLAASIGTFFGMPPLPGFRAQGGSVNARSPYIVGEKGPELFVPGSSGAIVPNNKLAAAGESGGSVNITYNIQSGVSRAELAPILENERKRLRNEIPDMVRRGGSYRAAFA